MTENNINKDIFNAPEWLDADFFIRVLHSCEKDESIKVKHFQLSSATVKGDNYASIMIRANVEYESAKAQKKSISMVIKTENAIMGEVSKSKEDACIFKTEIAIYTEVLPKFHAMLRQIGDETKLGPRYLYHSFSPKKLIVLEDIATHGYSMLRNRQLNMEEVKLAYLKLAKWHALSYKINQESPNYLKQFNHDFMEIALRSIGGIIKNGIKLFDEMLQKQPSLLKYQSYFKTLLPNLVEKCSAALGEYRLKPHKDTHFVLCHGDFHNKNMMFKHGLENQLQDILFFDFQASYMGAMDLDMIYSMFMMLSKELRLNHMKELINYYFSNFVATLEQLGYEGEKPRIIEFQQMLQRHGCFEIFMLVTFLPIKYKLDTCKTQQSWYCNEDYLAELEECLPKYLNLGYLK